MQQTITPKMVSGTTVAGVRGVLGVVENCSHQILNGKQPVIRKKHPAISVDFAVFFLVKY